jgi:hypothetical protein
MIRAAVVISSSLLVAAQAQAQPPEPGGHYSVRNDTRRTFTCTLRPEHGRFFQWFVLRPGGEWHQSTRGHRQRRLTCDDLTPPTVFWMHSGSHYSLYEDGRERVLSIRLAPPR